MDWLTIIPAQVTLPGFAAVCDLCHRTMYRMTLGEAQHAAVQHLEEEHGNVPKRRIWQELTEEDGTPGTATPTAPLP